MKMKGRYYKTAIKDILLPPRSLLNNDINEDNDNDNEDDNDNDD